MKRAQMKKNKGMLSFVRRRPFATLAFCLFAVMLMMVVSLPEKLNSLDRQDEQLYDLMMEYSDKQSELNSLKSELALTGEDDFVERVARRELEFSWYGETVYRVGNLDEIRAQQALEQAEKN